MNTQHIDLDVSKSPTMPQHVRIGQGDSSGTTIVATVYDNGVAATLAGMSARFCMRLPGGRQYVRDSDCAVSGSNITYVVDEEHCAAVRGRTDEAYFEILAAGSVVYSTNRFTVHVLRGVTDGAVPGETYDTEIERAIQRANDAAEAAEEAAGGVTPLMDASTRGGAMLGDGLALTGEKLGVDPLTTAQIDTVVADGSLTSNKVLTGTRLTYLWSKLKQKFASLVNGAVAVSQGGTGKTTHTTNAVLTGNGTNAVNNVATADGALYATAANGAAQFGTLPVTQGGTGAVTSAGAAENIVDGQAIEPASVAATGEVSGKKGTTTHTLSDKAESGGSTNTLQDAEDEIGSLESSIAYVESVTAKTNHAVGDYFILGNALMRATAAIATGETINASKATPATVQGQIDTLRDSVEQTIATQLYIRKAADKVITLNCTWMPADDMKVNGAVPLSQAIILGTIPSGLRPSRYITCPVMSGNGTYVGRTNIGSNGVVSMVFCAQPTSGIDFTVTYTIA